MDFKKVWTKAFKGFFTVIASLIIANQPGIIDFITGFLPEGIDPQMTIAATVGAIIIGLTNWLKHRGQ